MDAERRAAGAHVPGCHPERLRRFLQTGQRGGSRSRRPSARHWRCSRPRS